MADDEQFSRQLTAARIRAARFPTVQRGYDFNAVHDYLGRIADEVVRLQQRLVAAHTETDRIKHVLRQWQADHEPTCRRDPNRKSDRVRWPIN